MLAGHTASSDAELRDQLSNLQGLLMLSMLMTEGGDEDKILHLAATSVPSFGRCHLVGVFLGAEWWQGTSALIPAADVRAKVEAQLAAALAAAGHGPAA